jgi:hypothetical protein
MKQFVAIPHEIAILMIFALRETDSRRLVLNYCKRLDGLDRHLVSEQAV